MNPEVRREALRIFDESLRRSGEDRRAFLDMACSDNMELQQEVESLLSVTDEAAEFMGEPLVRLPKVSNGDYKEGDKIGCYRILRPLGSGGMGAVYLAVRDEPDFEMEVAIKVVRPDRGDGEDLFSKFLQEQEFLARLSHPNIARPIDRGKTEDGLPYLVMEYVDGTPIDRYCEARKLSTVERLKLFCKVCAAVQFAHQHLIVHRDLKPANLLVTDEGEPKLLDFGIARFVDPSPFSSTAETLRRQTSDGFLGTLRYASPEQVRSSDVTTASDVYSLGVALYELLTGHHPFERWSHSFLDLSQAICAEEPEKPSTAVSLRSQGRTSEGTKVDLTPERVSATRGDDPGHLRRRLSGDLDNIVLKALNKKPEERYASPHELADDLDRHLNGLPVSAREPTFLYQMGKFLSRHTVQFMGAGFVLLLIICAGLLMAWFWREEREARVDREKALYVSDFLLDIIRLDEPGSAGSKTSARDLLDQGRYWVEREMETADRPTGIKDQVRSQLPENLPGLLAAYGWLYFNLGSYGEAEEWIEKALERQRAPGTKYELSERSITLLRLAAVRRAKGLENTGDLSDEALKTLRAGGVDALRVAQLLHEMGWFLYHRGDVELAEKICETSVAMKRRLLGDRDIDVALGLNNLAVVSSKLGKFEEGVSAYRDALEIMGRVYGEDSVELAGTQNNLASLLRDQGYILEAHREQSWREAEELFRESLRARRVAGAPGDSIALVLKNQALLFQFRGKFVAASAGYLEQANAGYEEALQMLGAKDDSAQLAEVLRNRATLYLALGRLDEAEHDARRALEILVRQVGESHWKTSDARSVLGECLLDLGRVEDAKPLLEQSARVLDERSRIGREARERLAKI